MNDELPDYSSIGLPGPEDISVDGTLGLSDTRNVQSTDSPDYTPLAVEEFAPLDNINGTSTNNNNGDPTPAINNMFSTNNLFGSALDLLTGGATGLADQLSGAFTPVPANQVEPPNYFPLILGAGALILIIVVFKK